MPFSLALHDYATSVLPSLEDWKRLWHTWDLVTQSMLPDEELLDQPISLRNPCIFYLGHIPAFLDIQLTKTTKQQATEPAHNHSIFERGIDPDVENPGLCHSHSESPEHWPPVSEILSYQAAVRDRLTRLYSASPDSIPRDVGRSIWIGYEHEAMHLETLLYMMLQSDKTRPPHPNSPNFEAMAVRARAEAVPNRWFTVPAQRITLGMDDPEDVQNSQRGHYAWDNEKPSRQVDVPSFEVKGRPITNEEYAAYLHATGRNLLPASWSTTVPTTSSRHVNGLHTNGHSSAPTDDPPQVPASFLDAKAVKTVYGPIPLRHALDWPVFASYDELSACAQWLGGRIPTVAEASSIYAHVDHIKMEQAENTLGKKVPAVNGHLINDGVEESPPSHSLSTSGGGEELPSYALFTTLDAPDRRANVGFQHWHPVAVTAHGNDRPAGRAEMGGVWEWTSSPLTRHDGFEPTTLYPTYTADFFEGKHNIVLGGSWATVPRIASRKSFVNWYQRNYPYAWVGARLVRDLQAQ